MPANRLTHFPLCPHSRSIRLALSELGLAFECVEERSWEFRPSFLALNPAGELPVLEMADGLVLCGAYAISEYLADTAAASAVLSPQRPAFALLPADPEDRAEVRRLIDWFNGKFHREVSRELLTEKVYPRLAGGMPSPSTEVLRAVQVNLRYHLRYLTFLSDQRRWLAGDSESFADLAAAAHISLVDYIGDIPWDQHPGAKAWYGRMKSRPSFRPLLADRIPGFAPPAHYSVLDF